MNKVLLEEYESQWTDKAFNCDLKSLLESHDLKLLLARTLDFSNLPHEGGARFLS